MKRNSLSTIYLSLSTFLFQAKRCDLFESPCIEFLPKEERSISYRSLARHPDKSENPRGESLGKIALPVKKRGKRGKTRVNRTRCDRKLGLVSWIIRGSRLTNRCREFSWYPRQLVLTSENSGNCPGVAGGVSAPRAESSFVARWQKSRGRHVERVYSRVRATDVIPTGFVIARWRGGGKSACATSRRV